jgi:outer membrane protein
MKKLITLLAMAGSLLSAHAQSNQELNNLIQQSFRYFPRVQEADKAVEIAELRTEIARTNYLPTVNGVGSYSYNSPVAQTTFATGPNPLDTRVLQFQPNNNVNLNVAASQVLLDFGKTRAQVEKAKSDLLISKQGSETARLQLAAQVASIYYSMIYLKKAAEVQDSAIHFFEETKKVTEDRIKNGDALQIDAANIQSSIDQEKNRKLELNRLFNRQVALMKFTTGQSGSPSITSFDFMQVKTYGIEGNPEWLAATERIRGAEADAKLASANRLPTLSLQAGAGFRNGYQPDIFETRFNYLAGVTLNVPIFQGGRIGKSILASQKSHELSKLSKQTLIATLQKEVESAQSDIQAYSEQAKNSDAQVLAATQTSKLTQSRYQRGVATYLDLINASSNLQRASLGKLQYEYQRTLAQIELARLQGEAFWQRE